MHTQALSDAYRQELIRHCARFSLDGLPAAGEILFREIRLEDIYTPLRLTKSKETVEQLSRERSLWDAANEPPSDDETAPVLQTAHRPVDETELSRIDALFSEGGIHGLKQLIAYLDGKLAQLHPRRQDEHESLIALLDAQIAALSGALPDVALTGGISNLELFELRRQYEDKPVGPVLENLPSRKVILSGPGCGKTTLAKRISLAYAAGDAAFKAQHSLPGDLYPVLLYCRMLNGQTLSDGQDFASIAQQMTQTSFANLTLSPPDFAALLDARAADGTLLLVIDGFDELFDKENRRVFAAALCDFLLARANTHLILTSRSASFADADRSEKEVIDCIERIPHIRFNILPVMNREEREDFVRRWHAVLFPFDAEKTATAEHIIAQLGAPSFAYLRKMACVPLHLSNILLVARGSNRIPHNKVSLYQQYMTVALNWHATGNVDTRDMEFQLAYVACYMMKKSIQRISRTMLTKALLQCYRDLDGEFITPMKADSVDPFIDELEERTCVLQKVSIFHEEDIYQFIHLNLQEYLAAFAIVSGCSDEVDNARTTVDVLGEHCRESRWREVIILAVLLLDTDRSRQKRVVDFLIGEAERDRNNYHINNILFELIAQGVPLREERRHAIYDLLFQEHITDYQVRKMCEFLSDARSQAFRHYVTERFDASLAAGDTQYCFAMATMVAFDALNDGVDPLEHACNLVMHHEGREFAVGLNIFAVLGWCKYSAVDSVFARSNIVLPPAFGRRLAQRIRPGGDYLRDLANALRDTVLAEYLTDLSCLDAELYRTAIKMLAHDETRTVAEKVLSTFPLDFRCLVLHEYEDVAALRVTYEAKYRAQLADGTKTGDTAITFSLCALLGCWSVANDTLLHEFNDLEGYYSMNSRHADDAALAQLRHMRRHVYSMSDPFPVGMACYAEGDFEGAKAAFVMAYEQGNTAVSNNLAYMLRRGEITDLRIGGEAYTVKRLLTDGLTQGDPFSVLNFALHEACRPGVQDSAAGPEIVRIMNMTQHDGIERAAEWWLAVAQQGEVEGYLVHLWLLEEGAIDHSPLGTADELRAKIAEAAPPG